MTTETIAKIEPLAGTFVGRDFVDIYLPEQAVQQIDEAKKQIAAAAGVGLDGVYLRVDLMVDVAF